MSDDLNNLLGHWREEVLRDIHDVNYLDGPRMKTLGIHPDILHVGEPWLYDFIGESNMIEGIERDPTAQEYQAHLELISASEISAEGLQAFVEVVQPEAKLRLGTNMNVSVGTHRPISGGPQVLIQLNKILGDIATSHPFEIYCRYETLHPFMDGNGRSGRALWLGMMIQKLGEFPSSFLRVFHYQALAMHDSRAQNC